MSDILQKLVLLVMVFGATEKAYSGIATFTNLTDQTLFITVNLSSPGKKVDERVGPGKTVSVDYKQFLCMSSVEIALTGFNSKKISLSGSSIRKGKSNYTRDVLMTAMNKMITELKEQNKDIGYGIDNRKMFNFMNNILKQRTSKYPGKLICKDIAFDVVYTYDHEKGWMPYLVVQPT